MKRFTSLCLSLLLALSITSPLSRADAQVLVASNSSSTLPMQQLSFQGIVAGRTYQFRTDPTSISGSEDTVMALMDLSFPTTGGAIAGADGDSCSGSGWAASCFEWIAPAGVPSTVFVRLWAWRPGNQGDATVQYRHRTGALGVWSPWTTQYTNIAFGGNAVATTLPSTGRFHAATRHRPGNNLEHWMWIAQPNEWQIVSGTNRSPAAGGGNNFTTIYDVPNVVTAGVNGARVIVAGAFPWTGNTGRMELIKNDWFLAGNDWDGDRLGQALETSLRTCDRPTSPNPSPGFTCASRWDCAGFPTSAQCQGALRDTDHDGLTDYLEVYEYNDPLLMISKWGADPAHMDVFMELDSIDQDAVVGGCNSYTADPMTGVGGEGTSVFFDRIASAWANGPTYINPDGSAGLRLHFDVGSAFPQSDPADTRWGNFGAGGTCVTCPTGGAGGIRAGTCSGFPQIRRSVFFYSVDHPNLQFGTGQARNRAFFGLDASHHAHELGHLLIGGHAGPLGTTGDASNDFGNYRGGYLSRMNYRFQDLGNTVGNSPDWNLGSFSRGLLGRSINSLDMTESCPGGPGVDLSLLTSSTIDSPEVADITGTPPNQCWNIDWNRSSSTNDPITVPRFEANPGFLNFRLNRRSEWTDGVAGYNFFTPRRGAPDMAIVNNVLLYAWTQRTAGGTYTVRWRGESTGDCNDLPIPRGPTLQLNHPEFYTGGSYPGCYRPGTPMAFGTTPVTADAVAVEREGTTGAIFVHNNAGTLRFSRFTVAPSETPQEFTASSASVNNNMLGATTITDASTTYTRREPALVQIPTSLETLLVYVDSGGMLRQTALANGGTTWAATVSSTSGSAISAARSVSMTTVGQEVWMAVAAAESIELYRLDGANVAPSTSRTWSLMRTLSYITTQRPNLVAIRDLLDPTQTRLALTYTAPGYAATYRIATSSPGVTAASWATGWRSEIASSLEQPVSGGTGIWDDRSIFGNFRDFRATRDYPVMCSSDATCRVADGGRPALDPTSTCNAGLCTLGGDPYVRTDFAPFTRGPAPGIYADYDDWRMVAWRACDFFASETPLPGSPPLTCGAIPRMAEPGPLPLLSTPPLNDRTANWWLYTAPLTCSPPQPCDAS